MRMDKNKFAYEDQRTVEYYNALSELQSCEKLLFEKYLSAESRILDIGIGAGRTTGFLFDQGDSYIGIDLSYEMIRAARIKFPAVDLRTMDARDLSVIESESMNLVVFSFNGIDNVPTTEGREKVFLEVRRCLVEGGIFIYSSHNSDYFLELPALKGASFERQIWRIIRSIGVTVRNLSRVFEESYRKGNGFRIDNVHGNAGLICHVGTRAFLLQEFESYGFECLDIIGNRYPEWSPNLASNWFYIAGRKR